MYRVFCAFGLRIVWEGGGGGGGGDVEMVMEMDGDWRLGGWLEKRSIRLLVAHGVSSKALGIAKYQILSNAMIQKTAPPSTRGIPNGSFCKKGNCIERARLT